MATTGVLFSYHDLHSLFGSSPVGLERVYKLGKNHAPISRHGSC